MAGHSKFKNIQHRKGAQDKKRAKIFGRLIKELTVAARGGTDAASNPRLRTALAAARAANMPKDNIERVLKKAEGGEGEIYDEIRYEGYGPGGTALIVEPFTIVLKFFKPFGAKFPSIRINSGLIDNLSIALFIESKAACKIFKFNISLTEDIPTA